MDYNEMLQLRKNTSYVTSEKDGEEVCIAGYLTNIRNKGKKLKFLVLSDRSGDVQITFKMNVAGEEMMSRIEEMTTHSFVTISGSIQKTDLTKRGVEIIGMEIVLMTAPPKDTAFPVEVTDKSSSNLDTRLDNRFLDLRRRPNLVIFQLLSDFANFSRQYFIEQGFMEIFSPKFVGAATEHTLHNPPNSTSRWQYVPVLRKYSRLAQYFDPTPVIPVDMILNSLLWILRWVILQMLRT